MSANIYRNRVRVRANGVLIQSSSVLLVKINSPARNNMVWMPPGGGLEFGESLQECVAREFHEETGLNVEVDEFLFLNEFIKDPIHAVELYFKVTQTGGKLKLGNDPEHDADSQLIKDIKWVPVSSLHNLPVVPEKLITYLEKSKP